MQNLLPQKFFLYARKSTDVEDKQVRSIEDQIAELRVYAKTEGLNIVEEFIEKQSAKIPGRPIFSEMTKRIERGDANGILAWHPDRLARNSMDGGLLIFLLDSGKLAGLKFLPFGAKTPHRANLCSTSRSGKANTTWIRLPRIRKGGCAKK